MIATLLALARLGPVHVELAAIRPCDETLEQPVGLRRGSASPGKAI